MGAPRRACATRSGVLASQRRSLVLVSGMAKPTGKKYKNEFGEELDVRREGLPDKYHANSTLTADIKAGENVIDFHLEK